MARCYIVDIDGTIADLTHRLVHIQRSPKDWNAFFSRVGDDLPSPHMRTMLYHLVDSSYCNACVVYVSGRPERCRLATFEWIIKHSFPNPEFMYMRKDGDFRDDSIVKKELLDTLRGDGFEPIMAFDDRNRVVKMWRENGVPCAQMADGDF